MAGFPPDLPPDHPYRALDPRIARLVWDLMLPASSYASATVVLDARIAGTWVGGGSGFVLRVGQLPPDGEPAFFLVTARHVALDAIAANATLEAQVIHGYDLRKPVQDRIAIALDNAAWMHNDHSDVSIIPFPTGQLPDDHSLSSVPASELASRKPSILLSHSADLKVFGRWSLQPGAGIPIVRTVSLASFERPTAHLLIGGARQPVEVYLADGTVSAGMSGGLVAHLGGGWGNSGVLGVVHGYWPLSQADLAAPDAQAPQNEREAIVREIRTEIGAMNSGIFFFVPIQHIEPLLQQAGYGFVRPDAH